MGDKKKSFWDAIKQKTTTTAKQTVDQMGKVVEKKATEVKDSITQKATHAGKNIMETATDSIDSVTQKSQGWMQSMQGQEEASRESTAMYDWSLDELYHIFLGEQTITSGGYQTVTLKTGKSFNVTIPPNRIEGSNLRLKGCGLQGNDAFLILHTLVNPEFNIDRKINRLIVQAPLYDRSKIRCLEAYNQINMAQGIDDISALNLLDTLVSFSKLDAEMGQHYTIASQNGRLVRLQYCLETALSASRLNKTEQQLLKATFQYLAAGEAVPNLQALTQLDTIILNSALPTKLKQYYFYVSVTARVMTLDLMIIHALNQDNTIDPNHQSRWLSVYRNFRVDKDVIDAITLTALDQWLPGTKLPATCKAIYQLMRHHRLELTEEFEPDDYQTTFQLVQSVLDQIRHQKDIQSVPENKLIDVSQIPSKSLAETAYNSVSRGGLGLLAGEKMVTDINLFLEVTARVAIAQVCQVQPSEKVKLGLSAVNASRQASVAGSNWQAVGSFGTLNTNISQLSGVEAYQAILEELEGVTHLIEQTGFTKPSQGNPVFNLIKGKQEKQQIIQALEAQMYS